jgi:L-ascorbate metabolism protein UlaG (beta-lactamase superfamily)
MASRTRTPSDGLDGIDWLGHAGFRIKTSAGWVYVDPYRAPPGPTAALILVTHGHFDHFSRDDVLRLAGHGTVLVAPSTVTEHLRGKTVSIAPGDMVDVGSIEITALPAYNTNKLDSEGRPFHVLGSETVGYVIRDGGRRIYHCGDTDVIPEMDEAAGVDVALLPVSGTYVMTPIEAAEAARRIDPGVAVPMHWGTVIGSRADAEAFVSAASVETRILDMVGEED